MKEPYSEDLASHAGPESCAATRKGRREALIEGGASELWSRDVIDVRGANAVSVSGRQHSMSCPQVRDQACILTYC